MPQLEALIRHGTRTLLRSFLTYRTQFYSLTSVGAVSIVILNALRNYSNFYSVAIHLSKSSRSVLVLANFAILLALFCGHIVQRIFFGTLRANEVERLYDRLWFFITESLLAFTIFRDEFDMSFVLMFGFLLFVKSFHWLAGDRIEWMDQQPYPGPTTLFHLRMASLFVTLWLVDFIMFMVAIDHTITYGVGGMVLFASEYGILMASIVNIIFKYFLSVYELRRAGRHGGENAPPWENKSMWVFYIELATDFLKLTTYLVFFIIIITFYGLPLNIVRDVYITARSFITRLRALHRYQTATRNMDQRYPNATETELAATSDRTCIICREDMVLSDQDQTRAHDGPNVTPKKLPCGHIFHFNCLRSWLERQQSCPTCRQTVLETDVPPRAPNVLQRANNPPEGPPANNNAANNLLGNPLGLLGRILGPPGQGINPNPVGVIQNLNPGPNNPVVIEYHIQYQVPRLPGGTTDNRPQNTSPTLHPIQPFQGFRDPNGAWQHWPANQDNGTHVQHEIQRHSSPQLSDGIATTTPSAESQDSNETENPENPRAAAARAALSRLNRSPSTAENQRSQISGATDRVRATRASVAFMPPTVGAPQLIPLHNYGVLPPHSGGPIGTSQPSGARHPTSTTQSTSVEYPLHIADAQLSSADQQTRDAIDQRLRVIGNVSETLHRCVEDLLRLRSTLPKVDVLNGDSRQHSNHGTNGPNESLGNSNSRKGKGVDQGSEYGHALAAPADTSVGVPVDTRENENIPEVSGDGE